MLRVMVTTVAGDAFLKFLVGQMIEQLGKHGATGVHAAFLPLPFAASKLCLRALSTHGSSFTQPQEPWNESVT